MNEHEPDWNMALWALAIGGFIGIWVVLAAVFPS